MRPGSKAISRYCQAEMKEGSTGNAAWRLGLDVILLPSSGRSTA